MLLFFRWGVALRESSPRKSIDAEGTYYLVNGKVKAHIKGLSEFVEFGAGVNGTFPKGLIVAPLDVSAAVDVYVLQI
ncbi:hypothetical protein GW17_00058361 [Ensete ventricosum]|nr:hypothetical protein GW17_00058361 [Ensete ventricosum]